MEHSALVSTTTQSANRSKALLQPARIGHPLSPLTFIAALLHTQSLSVETLGEPHEQAHFDVPVLRE